MTPRQIFRFSLLTCIGYIFGGQFYTVLSPLVLGEVPEPPSFGNWPTLERIKQSIFNDSQYSVFIVTPTYRRASQIAELTRLAQALYPVRHFVRWLILEDAEETRVNYPNHTGFLFEHLIQFSKFIKLQVRWSNIKTVAEANIGLPKGVDARRDAIDYVRAFSKKGVIYFVDDDNTYDSDIFRQILGTKRVSVWPTGGVTDNVGLSAPVVNSTGVVFEVFDGFKVNRKFPLDFSGFAVNIDLLRKNKKATIPYIESYEETMFLGSLDVPLSSFEPLSTTKVLTWHTKSLNYKINRSIKQLDLKLLGSNIEDIFLDYSFIRDILVPSKKYELAYTLPNLQHKSLKRTISSPTPSSVLQLPVPPPPTHQRINRNRVLRKRKAIRKIILKKINMHRNSSNPVLH